MGSLQLEPATISIKPPTRSPSSPLHESDFEEEKYLVGEARGFYMNNGNVDKRIDKEKVSSVVGYGDERRLAPRSSRYGSTNGCLGTHHQQESKASIFGDDGYRKNNIYLGYGEEFEKKSAIREEQGNKKREEGQGVRRERGSDGDGGEGKKRKEDEKQGVERLERWSCKVEEERKQEEEQGEEERERWSGKGGGEGKRESSRGEGEEEKRREKQGEQREKKIWRVINGGGEERRRVREEGSKEEEEKEKEVVAREKVGKAKEEEKGGGGGGGEGGEVDYVHRGQWLRAAILGANDGLVSTASLMMGVGAVKGDDAKAMIVSGLAGLVGGACSMAIGEFVSVYSQRDAETFDKKSKNQKKKLASLADTHFQDLEEGKSSPLDNFFFSQHHPFKKGSHDFTCKDIALHSSSHAHTKDVIPLGTIARDKLSKKQETGKQKEEERISAGPSPWEAAGASGLAFALGAMVPLLSASFIKNQVLRLGVMIGVSSGALLCMGAIAAMLSAGNVTKGGVRVLLGGWAAMLATYGLLRLFGTSGM